MIQSKGYAASEAKKPLKPFTFTRSELGPSDILIDIKYCGICHSDIHQVNDEWGKGIFPMVPGHEIVGHVSKVGGNVTKFKIGDTVGVGCFVDSCRQCDPCRRGLENYCEAGAVLTYNSRYRNGTPTYGGYANNLAIDENYALRIPSNLPLDAAAPLLCAGITMYSPLKHWRAGPGKRVAVLGLGGLGHIAVKLARAMGAEVTVLSHSDRKKADSLKLGAHHFVNTSDPHAVKGLQRRFDIILNTVAVKMDWQMYISMLRLDGAIVAIGLPEEQLTPVALRPLLEKRCSVAGSAIGSIAETQEMFDFCSLHNITCDVELIPVTKIGEAYERILKSDVRYRFVIDMKTLDA